MLHQGTALRTTLAIADDVLFAANELAQREKKSMGQVISELARRAFACQPEPSTASQVALPPGWQRLATYGICPLPKRGGIVSNQLIDRLRETEGT